MGYDSVGLVERIAVHQGDSRAGRDFDSSDFARTFFGSNAEDAYSRFVVANETVVELPCAGFLFSSSELSSVPLHSQGMPSPSDQTRHPIGGLRKSVRQSLSSLLKMIPGRPSSTKQSPSRTISSSGSAARFVWGRYRTRSSFCLTGAPHSGRIYPLGNADITRLLAWYPRKWRPH